MTEHAAVPTMVEAQTNARSETVLTINGEQSHIAARSLPEARDYVLAHVRSLAAQAGQPVQLISRDPGGEWHYTIQPDGRVDALPAPISASGAGSGAGAGANPVLWPPTSATATPASPAGQPDQPAPRRASFLPEAPPPAPPRTGWRGTLARLGIKLEPSQEEQRYNADVETVSRHWPGPRTIVVANGKGGSSKTPVVIGLSAVFARFGGGGVCAWSNHQMRGTLGWHTVQSPHAATTQDLLSAAPSLLAAAGQVGDLARYVHHQPGDRFDVLQADPTKTSDKQRIDHNAVDTIHQLLSRYYRLIVMDSDNDESTAHWRRMMDHADQLVVATTTDDVRAETGRLMLEDLVDRGPHAARLAKNAVVVVSQAHQDEPPAARVAARFQEYGLPVSVIPYDQGMKRLKISYDGLQPSTQRAYLAAAAMVARAISATPET